MTSCDLTRRSPTPCSVHVPLLDNETAEADSATWPASVQAIMARELDRWSARNPDIDIVEQNFSIDPVRRICVCEFFHSAKVPA
jgi:hypothetical protein